MAKDTNQDGAKRRKRKAEDVEVEKEIETPAIEVTPPTKKHKTTKTSKKIEEVVIPEKKQRKTSQVDKETTNNKKTKAKQDDDDDDSEEVETPKKAVKSKKDVEISKKADPKPQVTKTKKLEAKEEEEEDENDKTEANDSAMNITYYHDNKEWSKEERSRLLQQVKEHLPKDDIRDYNTTLKRLNWSEVVKIKGRTTSECAFEYLDILKQIRKYRTMAEILTDAKNWLDNESDKPKKPLSAVDFYVTKHRIKYQEKHPDKTPQEIISDLHHKFAKLNETKKKKYSAIQDKAMAAFKQMTVKPKKPLLKVPMTPKNIFMESIYEENKNSNKSKIELFRDNKMKWKNMSDNERIKYILEAVDQNKHYMEEMAAYQKQNVNYKPPAIKSVLTKFEQQIKDKFDKKPVKPPMSGYAIFSKKWFEDKRNNGEDNPQFAEMTALISKDWKELSEQKRKQYNDEATELKKKYNEEMEKFRKKNPDLFGDDKTKVNSSNKNKQDNKKDDSSDCHDDSSDDDDDDDE